VFISVYPCPKFYFGKSLLLDNARNAFSLQQTTIAKFDAYEDAFNVLIHEGNKNRPVFITAALFHSDLSWNWYQRLIVSFWL
jgi:hypothetical protein